MPKNSLNRSLEYEPYYKALGKPDKNKEILFNSIKDVYMLAMVVGFKYKRKKPIKKSAPDPIKLIGVFNEEDKVIMDIIALYENINEKDLSLLTDEKKEDKYKLMEEYANGGMEILIREICNKSGSLDDLKNFAKSLSPKIKDGNDNDILDMLFKSFEL